MSNYLLLIQDNLKSVYIKTLLSNRKFVCKNIKANHVLQIMINASLQKSPLQYISHIKHNFLVSSQQTIYLSKVNNRNARKKWEYISN